MTTEKIEVWLGYGTSEEQGKSVREAFSEAGLPVEIRYESAYPGIGNGAGFTIFIGIFGAALGHFFGGFLSAAGTDAYEKAKKLLRTLKEDHLRRYPSQPPTSEGLLRRDIPDRAHVELIDTRW